MKLPFENMFTLLGDLTELPALRFTERGVPVVTFGMTVLRQYRVNDEIREITSTYKILAWGDLAENVAGTLGDLGARIFVTGTIDAQNSTSHDGDEKTRVLFIAHDIGPSLRRATAEILPGIANGVESSPTPPPQQPETNEPQTFGSRYPDPIGFLNEGGRFEDMAEYLEQWEE